MNISGGNFMGNIEPEGSQGQAKAPEPNPFSWISDDQIGQLLGNARPKTLADIESSGYWDSIFQQWVDDKGGDIQAAHQAWKLDTQGEARDTLKKAGPNGDLRNDFYEELGTVKAWARQRDISSGAAEARIDEAMGGIL
jgi:hypothetical protein